MAEDLFAGLDLFLDAHPMPPSSGLARSLVLPPETIAAAAERLLEAGYHLEDIGGLDCAEGILVNYHFNRYERFDRIVLRVLVPHENGSVPSIAAVFSGAEWHEREVTDFFGVTFAGNPNPSALLLPAEDRSTPLRKKSRARRAVRELMDPGVVVHQVPGFDWFGSDSGSAAPTAPSETGAGEKRVNKSGDKS
jgi:NADH-quinone oxidoreductase subunit C